MTDMDPSRLNDLSKAFLREIPRMLPGTSYTLEFTDKLEVAIPAICREVGDIHIWMDEDEITVGIGQLFHSHFETYLNEKQDKEISEKEAISRSLKFIKEFIAGDQIIEINYRGARVVSASVQHVSQGARTTTFDPISLSGLLDCLLRRKKTTKRFNWQGPVA